MPGKEGALPSPEQAPLPYYQAAHFDTEQAAATAYFAAQAAIYQDPANDLSIYRLQINQVWHVVVLGEPPPPALEQQLLRLLAAGHPAVLPAEIVQVLTERRAQATTLGPWVEGHYRPGKRLPKRP
jgi:hypothetical protein